MKEKGGKSIGMRPASKENSAWEVSTGAGQTDRLMQHVEAPIDSQFPKKQNHSLKRPQLECL